MIKSAVINNPLMIFGDQFLVAAAGWDLLKVSNFSRGDNVVSICFAEANHFNDTEDYSEMNSNYFLVKYGDVMGADQSQLVKLDLLKSRVYAGQTTECIPE